MKYLSFIKDLFLVIDEYKDTRISEAMIVHTLVLLSSGLILFFGIDLGFTQAEYAAIAAGIYSIVGIIVRYRSKGGVSKLKEKK